MTTVLYTEANGFGVVFTREVEVCCFPPFGKDTGIFTRIGLLCFGLERALDSRWLHLRRVRYSGRPGSASAVGCWSRLEDANWRLDKLAEPGKTDE